MNGGNFTIHKLPAVIFKHAIGHPLFVAICCAFVKEPKIAQSNRISYSLITGRLFINTAE